MRGCTTEFCRSGNLIVFSSKSPDTHSVKSLNISVGDIHAVHEPLPILHFHFLPWYNYYFTHHRNQQRKRLYVCNRKSWLQKEIEV